MIKEKIRYSLKVSFWDGFFASCMMGFTTDYITPYALALKANVSQVGILNALPNFFSSLVQLKSADFSEKIRSKKKIIIWCVFLQALMVIPIILIPYVCKGFEIPALILFVSFFTASNGFALPVWQSLMSEYLPSRKRGTYFGWRTKILGIVTISCMFAAGFVLQFFKNNSSGIVLPVPFQEGAGVLSGFMLIFLLAFICRFVSWYFLTRMYEPPFRHERSAYFSIIDFIKIARGSNFARFVFFAACLNFSMSLASPFFSVYMLRDLKFGYLTYTVLIAVVTIASVATIHRWGIVADKYGNFKLIRFNSMLIACLPFLWMMCRHPAYIFLVQGLGGLCWAGFNLCALNFIYDAVSPAKRTRCIAYYNFFNGFALFLGPIIGGSLAPYLPPILGYRLMSLFLISGLCRVLTVCIFSGKIKEVRPVEGSRVRDIVYSIVGLKPVVE
ncbi:MAG: MFS transporter [Candidatus Omnitrophica bacterium]|nr:MFS transporter [Candidatus Omnitrophota bacterium]